MGKQDLERFWSRVQTSDGCWEWNGVKDRDGYGRLTFFGKSSQLAHRVSWGIHRDESCDGLVVRHSCDNPGCVRPEHLSLGTSLSNQKDKADRGRSGNGFTTGTNDRFDEIHRQVLEMKTEPKQVIAHRLGIHIKTVRKILNSEIQP